MVDIEDWPNTTLIDVFNGYDTFYTSQGNGFIDPETQEHKSSYANLVKFTYFAITTLSTIGFGDFSPLSVKEKALWVFILLLGVAIFSIIMNKFIIILTEFKEIDKVGHPKDLSKWIAMLSKFNEGQPLGKDIISKIEDFFDFYWN